MTSMRSSPGAASWITPSMVTFGMSPLAVASVAVALVLGVSTERRAGVDVLQLEAERRRGCHTVAADRVSALQWRWPERLGVRGRIRSLRPDQELTRCEVAVELRPDPSARRRRVR